MELWHLTGHLIIALIISFFLYRKTKDLRLVFLCVFVSFAIDLDHLFDFWLGYGFSLDLVKFFEIDYFRINQGVFVPFHSWELVGLIFLLSKFVKKYKWVLFTIALAMFAHILWDTISYKIIPIDYFLVFRASRGFKIRCGW